MIYLLTPKEIMPHSVYRLYAWLKRRVRRTITAGHLTVINYCEQAPNPESRVYLSDKRDALGVRDPDSRLAAGRSRSPRSVRRLHEILDRKVRSAESRGN